MKRNVRLLNKTADRIEKIPESYNQRHYIAPSVASPCGVEACLAGEIIIASEHETEVGIKKLHNAIYPKELAAKLAGMPDLEFNGIFGSTAAYWPHPYRARYNRARSRRGKAMAAAGLLRYLADGGEV